MDDMVCYRYHMGEQGGATEWFVRTPDGYLVSCGNDEWRADAIAQAIRMAGSAVEWTYPCAKIQF